MEVVAPPLNPEDRQEHRSAGDLPDNSTKKCATDQSWNNRDSCGDQRRADIAPGIFPSKDQPQHAVTQDPLDYVGQQDAKRRAGHSESRNQPEICAECYGAGDREISRFKCGRCTIITVSPNDTNAFVAQAIPTIPSQAPPCMNAGP